MRSNSELITHPDSSLSLSNSKSSDFRFSKSLRLLTPKEYSQVFADAEKFANRHWTFIVKANQLDYPRLGLAIAKKQLPRAVWRNRIKRIAREAFRLHKKELCGYDIVVLSRKGMQDIDSLALQKSFLHLVRKIRNSRLKRAPGRKERL